MIPVGLDLGLDLGSMFGSGPSTASGYYKKTREHRIQDTHRASAAAVTGQAAGAEEAGLHPLFAMGGSAVGGSSGAPISSGIEGQVSTKRPGPYENALIGEANAKADLYKAQANNVRWDFENHKVASMLQRQNARQDKEKTYDESSALGTTIPGGGTVKHSQGADAEDWEKRYWEIGGLTGALLNIGGDAVSNIPSSVWDNIVNEVISAKDSRKRLTKKHKNSFKRKSPSGKRLEPGRRGAGPQPYRPKTWR